MIIKSFPSKAVRLFLALWGILLVSGSSPQNPLCLALIPALWVLFERRAGIEDKRAVSVPIRLTALLYAMMTVAATHKTFLADYNSRAFRWGYGIIALIGLIVFWDAFLPVLSVHLLRFYDKHGSSGKSPADVRKGVSGFLSRITAVFCLICWAPYFLYEYPGIVSPDGVVQIGQVLGVEPLSNHHPIAHTALIGLFMKLGSLVTGNVDGQVAVYTLAQMVLLAVCCHVIVRRLAKSSLPSWTVVLSLLFFALVPYNGVFSVFVIKDVPFACILALFTCVLAELAADPSPGIPKLILFSLAGIALSVFRSNGFYAFIFCVPFILFAFRKQPVFRKLIAACAAVLILSAVYRGPVLKAAGVAQPDFAENISIPLQQIARVLVDDKDISQEDRRLIEAAVDTTWIKELYSPAFADNMKELLRAGDPGYVENNKLSYFLLWLRLGLRYPHVYLEAWNEQTKAIWYPDEGVEVAMIDGVTDNGFGLEWRPMIGGRVVVKAKELLLKSGPLLPVLSLLFSMGFFFWIMLYLAALTFAGKGKDRSLLMFLPSAAVYLTLFIAVPYGRTFRYIYPFVLCVFIFLSAPLQSPSETPDSPQTPAVPDDPSLSPPST